MRAVTRAREKLEAFMRFAADLAWLGTCSRLKVGAVVTDYRLERIYGIGYNGNAAGEPNECDSQDPGTCGCVHAEANALVKCSTTDRAKVMFSTTRPCLACAKLIVNSGFSTVFYMDEYRSDDGGAKLLVRRGVRLKKLEAIWPQR